MVIERTLIMSSPEEIKARCLPLGIEWGSWDISALDPSVCREAAVNADYQQRILDAIRPELDALKQKNGYVTEDVVCLNPEKPGLDDLLEMFVKEHHHTDDEVRVILYGHGIFGIVPRESEPFKIHMEAGDMIVIPAYTRHWFTLTPEREVVALRIFRDTTGWQAIYEPVCHHDPARSLFPSGTIR